MGRASDEAAGPVRRRPAAGRFRGAYLWSIVAAAAAAVPAWLAVRAYPVARAEFEADARRRAEQVLSH